MRPEAAAKHPFSMNFRLRMITLHLMLFFMANPVQAEEQLCFDFSKAIIDPLRPPLQGNTQVRDLSASGKTSSGSSWGAVRAQVNLSSNEIYERLLDHYLVKDSKKVKLRVYEQEWKGYSDFHVVMVEVLNPLISISWEENWAYLIAQGTKEDPERVVISYQKAAGTSHIARLCGSIVLTKLEKGKTEIYFYEEVQASGRRSQEETVQGHLGTLKDLRAYRKK